LSDIAKSHKDKLEHIKKLVGDAVAANKANADRFHHFQKFVYQTALSQADEDTLNALNKPVIEFNIVNAPISRLCGEFSKQEPGVDVSPVDGAQVDELTIAVTEGHLRHIMWEAQQDNTQYLTYRDSLVGGFAVFKVLAEYEHERSFNQKLTLKKVYDPTLVVFDPAAKEPTKRDAEYYCELCSMTEEEFKEEFPDVDISKLSFDKSNSTIQWGLKVGNEKVITLCYFYKKKRKKQTIVRLVNGKVMTMEDYKAFVEWWVMSGEMMQPPAIAGQPRKTTISYFCRYTLIGSEVIDYEETDFKEPNYIFVDGDSVLLRENNSSKLTQFTKPYAYHVEGLQRLLNFSGQVIANEYENLTMHKFMVAKESLPEEDAYLEAYENVQQANTLVYNAYNPHDPTQPLPAPAPVPRGTFPSEVLTTFGTSMQMQQSILGSYDAELGVQNKELSGRAIQMGAMQTGATALPYTVNYLLGLNQALQVIVDMIPKIWVTPRTIPIRHKDGKRSYIEINTPDGVPFKYDENALKVKVQPGVNHTIAKNQALEQLMMATKVSPQIEAFMGQEGMDIWFDNMEFKGVEIVKERADKWMEQQKQAAANKPQMPDPEVIDAIAKMTTAKAKIEETKIEQQKIHMQAQQAAVDHVIDLVQLKEDKYKNDTDRMQVLVNAGVSLAEVESQKAKAEAEEGRTQAELVMSLEEMQLKRENQAHEHLLNIHEATKPEKKETKK